MNVYEIEALVRSADQLRNYERDSAGDKLHTLLLERVTSELTKVETSDEVAALQASSNIKQANLNILAGKVVALVASMNGAIISAGPENLYGTICELKTLAENMIQPEPNPGSPG